MREPYRLAGLWGRVVLLVVLVWGGLVTAFSVDPPNRSVEEFRASLRAGEVIYVIATESGQHVSELRWSSGPLFWYRVAPLTFCQGLPKCDYESKELYHDVDAAGARLVVQQPRAQRGNGIFSEWPFHVPVPHGGWLVAAAWFVSLLSMLGTARPRLGNRWAWFWLFTVGEAGAIVFLLLEPRPVWQGLDPEVPMRRRMGGGQGCLVSIGLGIASGAALLAVSWLTNVLTGMTTG
ncbi:hypothetical protein AB0O34_24940 [Sphaerisporangium sp. NPDC088356]|uniref:hypothetical protein n=1 Tax=Sphaerisporangium sp. NPDC088356 TaxID=3154871 RepID=UPI00343F9EC2